MKKILAVVLIMALAIGLATTALADPAPPTTGEAGAGAGTATTTVRPPPTTPPTDPLPDTGFASLGAMDLWFGSNLFERVDMMETDARLSNLRQGTNALANGTGGIDYGLEAFPLGSVIQNQRRAIRNIDVYLEIGQFTGGTLNLAGFRLDLYPNGNVHSNTGVNPVAHARTGSASNGGLTANNQQRVMTATHTGEMFGAMGVSWNPFLIIQVDQIDDNLSTNYEAVMTWTIQATP